VVRFDDIDRGGIRSVIDAALARGGGWLDAAECQRILTSAGIPVAAGRTAHSAEEARKAAAEVGYPVALKAVGPSIIHKTEVGGVRLDLPHAAALTTAFEEMSQRLGDAMTAAWVQAMAPPAVEVVAGATADPLFGSLIMYGSGGALVELLADVAFRLHPITDVDAREMLGGVKGTALLRGFRGAPPADEAAVSEVLLRLSALLEQAPEIREIDLNPIRVLARGAVVVDARIRAAGPGAGG
jgi:acyl-CoA synthetase (NDP forming)